MLGIIYAIKIIKDIHEMHKNKYDHNILLNDIPELYRQFRLRNDPSMKIFEKNVKSSAHHCL